MTIVDVVLSKCRDDLKTLCGKIDKVYSQLEQKLEQNEQDSERDYREKRDSYFSTFKERLVQIGKRIQEEAKVRELDFFPEEHDWQDTLDTTYQLLHSRKKDIKAKRRVAELRDIVDDVVGDKIEMADGVALSFLGFLNDFSRSGKSLRTAYRENYPIQNETDFHSELAETLTGALEEEGIIVCGPKGNLLKYRDVCKNEDVYNVRLRVESNSRFEKPSYVIQDITLDFGEVSADDLKGLGPTSIYQLSFNEFELKQLSLSDLRDDLPLSTLEEVVDAVYTKPVASFRALLRKFHNEETRGREVVAANKEFKDRIERASNDLYFPFPFPTERKRHPYSSGFSQGQSSELHIFWKKKHTELARELQEKHTEAYETASRELLEMFYSIIEDDARILPRECVAHFYFRENESQPYFNAVLTFTLNDGAYTGRLVLTPHRASDLNYFLPQTSDE